MKSDINIVARQLLERVAKNGAYTEDDLLFIQQQWDRGYMYFQGELRDLLGIDED